MRFNEQKALGAFYHFRHKGPMESLAEEEKKMKVITVTDKLKPTHPLIDLDKDKVKYIVVHHSDSPQTTTWEDINNWHQKERGWSCAGYAECIYPNGDVYILRGMHVGANVEGWNSKIYGICLIGNFDKQTEVPLEQYASLIARIRELRPKFPNYEGIKGHKELTSTACPGSHFPLEQLKEDC